jgi:hypothetical protein
MGETPVVLATLQGVVIIYFQEIGFPSETNQTGFCPVNINPFAIQGLCPNPLANPLKPFALLHCIPLVPCSVPFRSVYLVSLVSR